MQSCKSTLKSRLLYGLLALAVLSMLVSLGFWQLDRAAQKKQQQAVYLEKAGQDPFNLASGSVTSISDAELFWRKGYASGHYLPDRQFILDNQILGGKPGYFVYVPFRIDPTGFLVLVNRGWVPAGFYREVVPDIQIPAGPVTLTGMLVSSPSSAAISFGKQSEERMENGISRMQNIDLGQLENILEQRLLPFIFRLDPESATAYSAAWSEPGSGAEIHLGYAFQWFALVVVFLILIVSTGVRRKQAHE